VALEGGERSPKGGRDAEGGRRLSGADLYHVRVRLLQGGVLDKAKYETVRLLYGQYPPLAAINYIWESKASKGTVVPNPYTEQAKMIVVESGTERLNQWVNEERNVYEDYKKAFGEEPPLISGVAIMTDTDNTGESATAYYGDIVFMRAAN